MRARPFIFDTDAANDDAIALVYIAYHPEVKLAAITVSGTGMAHGPVGAKNMANLCFMLGQPDVPIAYGSDQPCDGTGKPFPDFIRAEIDDVFGGTEVPEHPQPNISASAVDLIKDTLLASHEPVTILATGPLTNIAQFIQAYPEHVNKIARIVIMGGAVHVEGNIKGLDKTSDNQVAEWNIYADPKSAAIVFAAGIHTTLVPLDATNQVPMTEAFYESLRFQRHAPLQLIFKLLEKVVLQLGIEQFIKDLYLWDPLAAMLCLNPNMSVIESRYILMNLATGHTQPVAEETPGAALVHVAIKIHDAEMTLNKFVDEIKVNILNKANLVTSMSMYSDAESNQAGAVQQPNSMEKRYIK